jgi:phenylpropionate dioxygenase-like ring-hydroxylating dioxygenase large terminal subunit
MPKPFPLNAWYAACWDIDLGRSLFARTICGRRMVFYRRAEGSVTVLHDACWHRLLPLSMGKLDGDNVVCGYHGLIYEPGGRCVFMPSQETVNPSACVRNYPCVERYRLIWVWPGDPALADPDLVPDMHWLDHPDWVSDGATIALRCDYRLVLDNLMDLTHETFVHAGSIGNAAVAEAPFAVDHTDTTVNVTRWMTGIEPPPFWRKQLGKDGPVDRWQIIKYQAPSTIAIDVGVAVAGTGAPTGDRSQGVNNFVCNTITPETDSTCFYFWAFPRNYRLQEHRLTVEQKRGVAEVFRQDEAVLEAQQIAMANNPNKEFYNLNIDAGAMWMRRLIDKMVSTESKTPQFTEAAE